MKVSIQLENRKKIDSCSVDGFCGHCQTIFEALGCYYHFCPCRETQPILDKDEFENGIRKRESDILRRLHLEKKGYKIVEMRECEWWDQVQKSSILKDHVRKNFPYKLPLNKETLLTRILEDKLFGYVQCDLEVPEELCERFANFPPIFKNCDVGRENIDNFMLEYAEKNALLLKPQRMLISSYKLNNGIVIRPLLKFYLKLGLRCTKIHRFVEYTPQKCFNGFVQSVVDARREGDENPDSSVVAETMKLLGNSSYGYQIMDRSRHTQTLYLSDENTHKAINNRLFRRLNNVGRGIYEVELVKSTVEHREPIIVGFFFLQYAKLRMLELYYNFFDKFCDVQKFDELEMDTDSLYLALAHENLYDCIQPEMRSIWNEIRRDDCTETFRADSTCNFFPGTCCDKHVKHDKREPGLFKEEFRCTEKLCFCSKTYCCYNSLTNKTKFSSKGLNKNVLEENSNGPLQKYRRVLDDAVNVSSTNRGFKTMNHQILTYEQTKRGLSYFYPKRIVDRDGIHSKPLLKSLELE